MNEILANFLLFAKISGSHAVSSFFFVLERIAEKSFHYLHSLESATRYIICVLSHDRKVYLLFYSCLWDTVSERDSGMGQLRLPS